MFGSRRKRASSNPPLNSSTANANAATAAVSAFLKNQSSNASLSAAAAAAALRSRPTSPVSVGDVQTKRMLRRAGSNSSMASSAAGSARGPPGNALERRGSSGSMSERTFRDPSPARGVPSAPDAPPVPSIPKNITRSLSAAHRRTASLDPPARITSPPPSKTTGRGSSLGPGVTATAPRRAGSRVTSLSSVQELPGTERRGSRGSVNFSLPTSSRPTSPVSPRLLTSPSTQRTNPPRIASPTNSNLVYDPNTRSFLPLQEILAIEQRVQDASNEPVKKAKRISPKQNTGRHFADGTVGGRARGTAVDKMEAAKKAARLTAETPAHSTAATTTTMPISASSERQVAQPTTPAAKPVKPITAGIASDSESDGQSYIPNSSDNESEVSSPPAKFNTRAGALLAKRPSIVREDKEREEEEEDTTPRPAAAQATPRADAAPRTISPSPLPRSSQGRGHGKAQASASAAFAQERQNFRSASQPAPIHTGGDNMPATVDGMGAIGGRGAAQGGRVHSVSPARTTHFAQVPDHLAVKHSPPPRSISPRKSALKQSSSDSPRGQSPASGVYFGQGSNASETSAGSAGESEEQSIPRKKAVRVSFDESKVILGQTARQENFSSSLTDSPLEEFSSKRNWLGLTGRGKKKDGVPATDNDEVMQPRPALPSFGSIRERKQSREVVEERPLVKPPDTADGPAGSTEVTFGQSNDHLVGAVISQDHAARNAPNISKSREPLPPQVTSVEGSGYNSDGESTIGGDSVDNVDGGSVAAASATSSSRGQKPVTLLAPITDSTGNGPVPQIALSKATPPLDAHERNRWPDIPGSWSENNNSGSGSPTQGESPTSEHHAVNPTPATVGIAEPLPGEAQAGTPVLGSIASENLHDHPPIIEETEESDTTSVYSDAAEELSDIEGGFISLDAVVESPVPEGNAIGIATSPPHSPTYQTTVTETTQGQQAWQPEEPVNDDSWEKAQSYWGSLSSEKRLQMEREAREDAEASDSTIEAPKPTPKPKKKKKPISQQTAAQPVAPEPTATDRTYMILPGSKVSADEYVPAMRSSMRAGPPPGPPETHMRMSMRSQGVMRNSMRGPPPMAQQRGSLVKGRPISVPNSSFGPDPAAVNAHIRALSAVAAARESRQASQPPALQRKDSGDSESSFKRTRARENTSFRRSMRGSVDSQTGRAQSPGQSSRFSLRSLSPSGSGVGRLPFSSASASSTPNKNSMRNSLRSPAPAKTSRLIPGFGRGSSKLSRGNSAPPRSSRFVDSSDEEGDARPAFRSRFVDSSDDEGPAPSGAGSGFGRGTMRTSQPVRGIPRAAGVEDGDSSDLPDSDDEALPSAAALKATKTQNGVAPVMANNGAALGTSLLRRSGSGRDAPPGSFGGASPTRSRGGNFMNILRRKKDPSAKVRKADIESAARRDTPLERSRYDLQAMKRNDSYNSTGSGKVKLQKRNALTSWPLPPPEPGAAELEAHDNRPHTADAAGGIVGGELKNGVAAVNGDTPTGAAPGLGPRRPTVESLPTELGVNGFTDKGRKKKFGKLRKMFRLDE